MVNAERMMDIEEMSSNPGRRRYDVFYTRGSKRIQA